MDTQSELERVYREQGDRLWRAVYLYSGDREVASDAVAEAFAQALRRGEAVRSVDRWVWTVAFRLAAGALKERRRTVPLPRFASYEMTPDVAEVAEALRKLPPKQRGAIVLTYYADCSLKETASILDSTTAAVGVHLTRARRRLRTLLEVSDE